MYSMPMLILAVILAVMQATLPIPRKATHNQASQTAKEHSKADASQQNAAVTISPAASPSTPQGKEATTTESQKNAEETIRVRELPTVTVKAGMDWWNRAYVLLTAALVIVGIFGVRYARRSLRAIESQGMVMEGQLAAMKAQLSQMENAGQQTERLIEQSAKGATAAKESADALINSERAWVMVDVELRDKGVYQSTDNNITRRFTMIDAKVICTNEGKAVAWITQKSSFFGVLNELPHEFNELRLQSFHREPEPLAPGDVSEFNVHFLTAGYRGDGGSLLVFYGAVKYRDSFKENCETRFGYMVNIDNRLERIPGYPEYNKAT